MLQSRLYTIADISILPDLTARSAATYRIFRRDSTSSNVEFGA